MKRCIKCLYSELKPDLHFDELGVCSACRSAKLRSFINWAERKKELEAILETGKNSSGYDCIVPSSGGKDSHWQVLTLLEMGAKPLVVTAMTCHLTPVGGRNLQNLANYASSIVSEPDKNVRAKLNKLGLELVGDISWPEHVAIFTTPFNIACELGIPLIFYGECPQDHYGGPPGTEQAKEMTLRWVQEFGGFLGLRPSDMVGHDGITKEDMLYYLPPDPHVMGLVGIRAYWLGQFFHWDSHRNARVAKEAGMEQFLPSPANWWDHENLDNAQTGLHDYMMWRKYGYGRATAQLSVDVRNGLISREDALVEAKKRDGVFPEVYAEVPIEDVLNRIGVSRPRLMEIFDYFTIFDGPKCLSDV